jgi:hypothetical protein
MCDRKKHLLSARKRTMLNGILKKHGNKNIKRQNRRIIVWEQKNKLD